MFDIGWGELLLIAIVALVVIGPKELPGALRTVGQFVNKIRRMAGEFQNQFQEAMREAELHDLKKEVDEMAEKAASYGNFDPIADVRKELESTQQQIENAGQQIQQAVTNPVDAVLPPEAPASGVMAANEPAAIAPTGESAAVAPQDIKEPAMEPARHDAGGKPA